MTNVAVWTGTVHADNGKGRPACGSAKRTHSDWLWATKDAVTCAKCLAMADTKEDA